MENIKKSNKEVMKSSLSSNDDMVMNAHSQLSSASSSISSSGLQCYVLQYDDTHAFRAFGKKPNIKVQQNLERIFEKLVDAGINPVWLSIDSAFKVTDRHHALYVLPIFEGSVFDHLRKLNCRIMGLSVVENCLLNGQKLPKITHPVYSTAMKSAIVSFTGIKPKDRTRLAELVNWMNGLCSGDLTVVSTHLITTEVGSYKYKIAANAKPPLPILTPDWIKDAWDASQKSHSFCALDEDFINQYRLSPFAGLLITVSGIEADQRKRIADHVKNSGGTFCGEMRKQECSHLVTDSTTSQKYKKALQWAIKTVKSQWIEDCVRCGYCLDEEKYSLATKKIHKTKSSNKISTPEKESQNLSRFDADFSMIPPSNDAPGNSTQMSNVSVMVGRAPLNENTVLETPSNAMTAPMSSVTIRRNKTSSILHNPTVPSQSTLTVPGTKRKRTDESVLANVSLADASAIDDLDVSKATSGYFLDSTRIFFCGFAPSHIEKLKRIINAGGGTRKTQLTADVTHLVLGGGKLDKKVQEALKKRSLPETTNVVTAKWLTECYKHGKKMPVNLFIHPLWSETVPVEESPICSKRFKSMRIDGGDATPKVAEPATTSNFEDIMNQYMDLSTAKPPELVTEMTATDEEMLAAAEQVDKQLEQEEQNVKSGEESLEREVFTGSTFAISGLFSEEVQDELETFIRRGGGLLAGTEVQVDYLVTPLLGANNDVLSDAKQKQYKQIVSNSWLDSSVNANEVTQAISASTQESNEGKGLELPYEEVELHSDMTCYDGADQNMFIGDQIADEPWYHGLLSRSATADMMMNNGDWLIRGTERHGQMDLLITVKWDNKPRHFLIITEENNGNVRLRGNGTPTFTDIHQLLQYYKRKPITANKTILIKPVSRPNWVINSRDILKEEFIGNGAYGQVYKGKLKLSSSDDVYMPVAIKVCQKDPTKEDKEALIKEAQLMAKYEHPNVVKFYGIVVNKPPLMIVMEYCAKGSLINYLLERKGKTNIGQKIKYCKDAAEGMGYLSHEQCVHGDVAARNCLMDEYHRVKISDFGLAHAGQQKMLQESRRLPLKWMAPETLRQKHKPHFSTTTDIWSFGVLIWEVMMDGTKPFADMKVEEAVRAIKNGTRLQLAHKHKIPAAVVAIMNECWEEEPSKRPAFGRIVNVLTNALNQILKVEQINKEPQMKNQQRPIKKEIPNKRPIMKEKIQDTADKSKTQPVSTMTVKKGLPSLTGQVSKIKRTPSDHRLKVKAKNDRKLKKAKTVPEGSKRQKLVKKRKVKKTPAASIGKIKNVRSQITQRAISVPFFSRRRRKKETKKKKESKPDQNK